MSHQIELEEMIRQNNFTRETLINEETGLSQNLRLRRFFMLRPNEWIPLPQILHLGIAQYNARIFELRREGMAIENKIIEVVDGSKHTAFRYTPKAG